MTLRPLVARRLMLAAFVAFAALLPVAAVAGFAPLGSGDPGDTLLIQESGDLDALQQPEQQGPPWLRPGFTCDPDDPEGRGGPPWVCGPGGVNVQGTDAAGPPGPRWMRDDFVCDPDPDDPEDRGGPPWMCGPGGVNVQGVDADGPPGPRWLRGDGQCAGPHDRGGCPRDGQGAVTAGTGPHGAGHPGRGHGPPWAR